MTSTRTLAGHANQVYGLKLVSTEILASGSGDNTVKLWNITNGTLIRTLTGHGGFVEWSVDMWSSQILVSGSADQKIKLWNWQTGLVLNTTTTGLQIRSLAVLSSKLS